jgi:hypothetical protein
VATGGRQETGNKLVTAEDREKGSRETAAVASGDEADERIGRRMQRWPERDLGFVLGQGMAQGRWGETAD